MIGSGLIFGGAGGSISQTLMWSSLAPVINANFRALLLTRDSDVSSSSRPDNESEGKRVTMEDRTMPPCAFQEAVRLKVADQR